jgi:hypothetical protein
LALAGGGFRVGVILGPMPDDLRGIVAAWIEAGRRSDPPKTDDAIGGLFICGGPLCLWYLDAEGTVRMYDAWDETVEVVPDGPYKVGVIAIAAEHRPELCAWLPRRPAASVTCGACGGGGWLRPPWPRVQCQECSGLGWLPAADSG